MGNIVGVDLKLDEKYIEASVTEIVRASIVQALGQPEKIVRAAVDNAVNSYVDSDGKPCRKDSYRSKPYLQYLAEQTIEKTVREQMEKIIEENKPQFVDEIIRQLNTKKFKQRTAEAFIETMLKGAESKYKMPVKVSFEPERDEF